jgi:Trk K+ transport system NAD-binding subunit
MALDDASNADLVNGSTGNLRPRWRGTAVRFGLLVIVFGAGLAGFLSGVVTTDRPEIADAGIATKIYYTIGLFVLAGIDLGTPAGGPVVARALLWFAYFAAPAITAAAAIEGVIRVVQPERWRLRRIRRHVVIAGCGRIALLYLSRLRKVSKHVPAVLVESRADHPYAPAARDGYRAQLINGDINTHAVLGSLRVDHARRILLLTGNDFANLDAASKILALAPEIGDRIVVQVSDLRFKRQLRRTRVYRECTVFNPYQIAAEYLVETRLLAHFKATEDRDVVVLAGFGRFGQTVLDELQRSAPGSIEQVIIVDLEATARDLVFDEQVGFAADYKRDMVDGDASDLRVWRELEVRHRLADRSPVFILGSGNEATNIRIAMRMASKYPDALVVARTFFRSSFAEEVSRESGFLAFSVAQLLAESMPDDWFA